MSDIVKIDDEVFTTEDFVKLLKLNGRFDALMEDILREKLAVHAAKRQGLELDPADLQARADQFRRVHGLHRARETNDFFAAMGVTLDEFEAFLTDSLYHEKMLGRVGDDAAVKEFFTLNSPRFDSMEVSHIVMDSEGGAKEMLSYLTDDPEAFQAMAVEHSEADTGQNGGYVGKIMRGMLPTDVEAKVFNAETGDLLGPFPAAGGTHFEIFRIDSKSPARLDEETAAEVRKLLRDEWLAGLAKEHSIEMQ